MAEDQEQQAKPAQLVAVKSGERGLAPRTLDEMFRFAKYVVASRLAPESFKEEAQVIVAIQAGAEIGLAPIQSLNSFVVIKGKPTLWGDAALALVKRSDVYEYVIETVTGEGLNMVATVYSKRKNDPNECVTTFSAADAKAANLWGKAGPWTTHPKRMLKYKARAFNLRDQFPDVLMGMHLAEEMEGEEDIPTASYETRTPPREERKKVESTTIVGNPNAKPKVVADESTIKVMIEGCLKTFQESLPVELDTVDLHDHFRKLCSFVCGGAHGDYQSPAAFTLEKLTAINEQLKIGVPEPILEGIAKA